MNDDDLHGCDPGTAEGAAEAVASDRTRCPGWEAAAGPGLGCGQGPGHPQPRSRTWSLPAQRTGQIRPQSSAAIVKPHYNT